MHDIGKLVLASQLGSEYDEVIAAAVRQDKRIQAVEVEMLGVSHDVIGHWLVTRWRLPASLAEPIALHHAPERSRRYAETTAIVHIADLMVRGYGFGFAGDHTMPALSQKAWKLLGLNERKMRQAVERMHADLQEAMVQANLYVFS